MGLHHRMVIVLAAAAGLCPSFAFALPSGAADAPSQRHVVFSVHEDLTTRKRVRQESDVSTSFNNVNPNPSGMGGGVAKDITSATGDAQITVDVITVTADDTLGCDVRISNVPGVRRVWIGADGTVRAANGPALDPSVLFLLSLMGPRLVPNDAAPGGTWTLGKERFRLESVNEGAARLAVAARYGSSPANALEEDGWVDYVLGRLVPTKADLTIVQRNEMPSQSIEQRRHVIYALVSDSRPERH